MFANHYGIKGKVYIGEGTPRYDWGANTTQMGFFTSIINFITKAVRSYGSGLVSPSKEELQYMMKTVRWLTILMAISYMKSVLFNYNPDDDDEEAERIRRKRRLKEAPTSKTWQKLYRRSGPFPFLDASVRTNLDRDVKKEKTKFRINNWLELQALYITTRVGHDQEDWLIWPGYGLSSQAGILNMKTGALMNPTFNNAVNLLNYINADIKGDKAGLYQQDSGVYPWEKEGDPKWYSVLGQFVGLTGSFLDPAGRLKKMETDRKKLTVKK
jgi:hypothetical protein